MAMPKGWKDPQPLDMSTSFMPGVSSLSRPMIGLGQGLRVPYYKIKGMHQVEVESKKVIRNDNLKYFEIQPTELSHMLVFAPNANATAQQTSTLRIQDIREVKVSSFTKGTFKKKEDLIVEIKCVGADKREYLVKIDVEDKYAYEIVKEITLLKQIESDPAYWTHRSLTFKNHFGQINSVDLYSLTPFLSTGEEILWQKHKINPNKVIFWIDIVTNYRVFQYNYQEHKGAVIVFPSLDEVKTINEVQGNGFGAYNASSPYLSGIQPSGATGVLGDVVFYYQGSPWITFDQVNDPETLSTVVTTLNQVQSNTPEGPAQRPDQLSCPKCGNVENPAGSKFCNSCGSALFPVCPKCGNSNPAGALFCGQCGSKIN